MLEKDYPQICVIYKYIIQWNNIIKNYYQKQGSGTDVLLWILRNFQEHPLLQNTSGGCFWTFVWLKSWRIVR